MELKNINDFATKLYDDADDIVKSAKDFDAQQVYDIVDEISVLNDKAIKYLTMSQADYYEEESDHKLTLQEPKAMLKDLDDRIVVNHVDGSPTESNINFEYNHENPLDEHGNYDVKSDLLLISYSLQVVGAIYSNTTKANVRNNLSRDALVSLVIAANSVDGELN